MKGFRQLARQPSAVAFLLCLLVLGTVLALWQGGAFQGVDCLLHDQILTWGPPQEAGAPGVVVVGINERDISKYGWALDDGKLSRLLDLVSAQHPGVIGLDLYRDLPEPRSGQFSQVWSNALCTHTNVICIYGGPDDAPIPPPPAVADQPERIGFNAFPVDRDGVVRRALLFPTPDDGEQPAWSLAMQIVRHQLRLRGLLEPVEWDAKKPAELRLGRAVLHAFKPSDGPYVHDENIIGFQMPLDFRGARELKVISLDEVLSGAVRTNAFTGKIVLVGMTAASVNDFVATPLRAQQYGVLLHAQVVDQLLRLAEGGAGPTRFLPDWLEAAWMLVLALAGKQLPFTARAPARFMLWLCLLLALLTGIHFWSLWQDWWLPFAPGLAAFVGSAMLVMSYLSHYEKNMRDTLMQIFSRQVSPEIARDVVEHLDEFLDSGRPKAQRLTVTVLFTDLKNFSTVSEKMEPVELYAWLNRYLGDMADIVLHHHGVMSKFTGDGLMALFGVPRPHISREDLRADAASAVRCALAMGRHLVALHEEWKRNGQPTVSMRVGIYTGTVVAGSIGSAARFEYTVIGDVVNTASRLESYDKDLADPDQHPLRTRIFIGASTHELVTGQFVVEKIGVIKVKGKQNSLDVFQVHDEIGKP